MTTLSIATGGIRARYQGATGVMNLEALPKRTEVLPSNATVFVGETVKIVAKAYDVNDKEASGLNWQYEVLNLSGGGLNENPVRADGSFVAAVSGRWVIRAFLNLDTIAPGILRIINVETPLTIQTKVQYDTKLVWRSGDEEESPAVREYTSDANLQLRGNDRGDFVLTGLFGLASNASLLSDGLNYRVVLASGQAPISRNNTVLSYAAGLAINEKAEVLTRAVELTGGTSLYVSTENGIRPAHVNGALLIKNGLGFLESYSVQAQIGRASLTDDGNMFYLSSVRPVNGLVFTSSLILQTAAGAVTELASAAKGLSGLSGAINFDVASLGLTQAGDAYFWASGVGGQMALYRAGRGAAPERLVGTGDAFLGSKITRILGTSPSSVLVHQGGDVVIGVQVENGKYYYARYRGGDFESIPKSLQVYCRCGVYSHNAAGTLLMSVSLGPVATTQVGWWKNDGNLVPILTIGKTLLGDTVNDIEGATMDASGRIRMIVRFGDGSSKLVEFSGQEPKVLLAPGDRLPVKLRGMLKDLVEGSRSGPPLVSSAGGNLLWLNEDGVTPALLVGDRWQAGRPETFTGYSNQTQAPSGILAMHGPGAAAIYTFTFDKGLQLLRGALTAPNLLNNGNNPSINQHGDIVWTATGKSNDQQLFLTRDGATTFLLSNGAGGAEKTYIEGEPVNGLNVYRLDERGRVFVAVVLQDGRTAEALWENGSWRLIFNPKVFRLNNVSYSQETLGKTVGERIYTKLSNPGSLSDLYEYVDDWKRVVNSAEQQPDGRRVTQIPGRYDASRSGELAFATGDDSGWSVWSKRDGFTKLVFASRNVAESALPLFPDTILIQDDGTIYFGLLTLEGERLFYRSRAKP